MTWDVTVTDTLAAPKHTARQLLLEVLPRMQPTGKSRNIKFFLTNILLFLLPSKHLFQSISRTIPFSAIWVIASLLIPVTNVRQRFYFNASH
jgi:hypothetical protein